MSDTRNGLPADWQVQRLEKIASLITSGGTPTSGSPRYYLEYGGLPFAKTEDLTRAGSRFIEACELGISEVALKETAAKKYPAGTVLISMYGTIGLTKITAIEMAANQALCALIPPLACDSGYLYHHLEYTRSEWLKYSGQTTQANINGATVRAHEVPLPDPREQRKISEILDTLDTAIHETEAIIAKLKAVKQGLLHDLLTRGIAGNGELRPPQAEAPHLYKQSPLGWIPKEWEEVTLGEIVRRSGGLLQTGPFGSQLHAHEYVLDGIPVIMPQDIVNGELSVDSIARVNQRKATALSRHRVQSNDLVFSRRGDLSRCVAIEEEHLGWLCGTGCLLARLPAHEVNGYWLALVYTQPGIQTQVMGRAVGSTMANLNTSILAAITITRPPVTEQNEIARRLQSLNKRIRFEEEELEKRQSEKSALMDDLLTGRVRVTSLLEAAAP